MTATLQHLAGVIACLASGAASAADSQGNYAVWGTGGRSCHQFTQAGADASKLAPFRDYLMGYLTAFNALTPATYDAVGGASLEKTLAWLAAYCSEHKMDSFERAMGQMLLAGHDQRSRVPPGASRGWSSGPPSPATP